MDDKRKRLKFNSHSDLIGVLCESNARCGIERALFSLRSFASPDRGIIGTPKTSLETFVITNIASRPSCLVGELEQMKSLIKSEDVNEKSFFDVRKPVHAGFNKDILCLALQTFKLPLTRFIAPIGKPGTDDQTVATISQFETSSIGTGACSPQQVVYCNQINRHLINALKYPNGKRMYLVTCNMMNKSNFVMAGSMIKYDKDGNYLPCIDLVKVNQNEGQNVSLNPDLFPAAVADAEHPSKKRKLGNNVRMPIFESGAVNISGLGSPKVLPAEVEKISLLVEGCMMPSKNLTASQRQRRRKRKKQQVDEKERKRMEEFKKKLAGELEWM